MDIENALNALETLASSTSTSSSGPLNSLIDQHFQVARERLTAGSDPKQVIQELQKNVTRAKKDVEKGLKTWYAALGNVGKAVEKVSPSSRSWRLAERDRRFRPIWLGSVRHMMTRPSSQSRRVRKRWTGSYCTLLDGGGCGSLCRL